MDIDIFIFLKEAHTISGPLTCGKGVKREIVKEFLLMPEV